MFTRFFSVFLTILIVGFCLFLWMPHGIPFRVPIIIALITFCATAVSELMKYVVEYDKNRVRGI